MSFLDDILGESSALEKILEANWQDPAASIVRGMGLLEARRVADASDRLDLWGEGTCWLVLSGSLDILWSCPEGRVFLGKVEAGGLAIALSPQGAATHAIAIPSEDTEIVQTSLDALHAFSGQNGTVRLETMAAAWFESLSAMEAAQGLATPEASLETFRQAIAGASEKILEEGAARFGTLRHSRDTRSEVSKLKVDANVAAALAETVELVDRHFRPTESGGATFYSVARQVLRATGYAGTPEMVLPRSDDSEMDVAVRFCRRNNLQLRAVKLDEKWWTGDHGAFLGYMRETREPVALLQIPGGYEVSTPEGRKRVTPQIAVAIDPLVYAFLLPTPEGDPNPWHLMRFGLFGRGRDVRNIIFCLILGALFSLVAPISIGWLMGSVIPSAELAQVKVFTALLLVTAAATAMTGIVQSLAALRMEGSMQYRVQTAIWVHILNLRAQFFRKYNAGDLASRADSVDAMRSTAAQAVSMLMTSCVGAVFSLLLMFYYDWRVTLIVLLVSLAFSVVAIVYGRLILSYNQKVLDQSGKLQGLMLQITNTVPKLRVAGAENRAFAYWMREYRTMVGLSLHQSIQNYRLKVIRSAFPYLLTLVVLGMIGFQLGILFDFFASTPLPVEKGNFVMPTSRFVSLNVAIGQFTSAMFMATRGILHFYLLKPHYNRVLPILEAEPEEDADYEELTEIRGDVELRDVTFRYSTSTGLVLSNLSFIAEQNKTTALVGTSGAGKSTILRLLLGFDEPESGTVLVDGNDVAFLNKKSLRQLFGVVIQDGSLLSGSIYDNVAVGHPYTMEEVSAALEIAGFAEEIKSWPMGLNTMIGDGAAMMSKGQQQRLMIARAVIRKPRILLLDEATSALDNITQARVTENLNKMNCTQIIVAHRLSTIKTADKIIVLDKGQVAEQGTYDELIAANGHFARLVMRQLK
ncbi:ATP-binding cassette domain-containing protein [Roseibium litorale]|uniref:ATP-binding cassette domain-containing protein n=1 Tax=Roseibium litorale TaxID=2803841 RepID=A0ABR9CKT1_9HYPH|nr:ATP-binding cassette domain-containing protein [Roseibium litorale]MBD8891264.1 ATP-binding cassette domain-containing protein [Roseibium litorale]